MMTKKEVILSIKYHLTRGEVRGLEGDLFFGGVGVIAIDTV